MTCLLCDVRVVSSTNVPTSNHSFGTSEIPLSLLSFYLFNDVELGLIAPPFGFKVL